MNKPGIAPGIEGLIFDLDGTLADTMPVHFESWREAFSGTGFDFNNDLFHELAGIPTREIAAMINRRYGHSFDPDEIEKKKESAYMDKLSSVKPVNPVMDLMKESHGKYKMSVGTGARRFAAVKTIELLDIHRYIDIIVTADDVTRYKPFPDTFLKCAEMMGVSPEKCQVFEDGIQGIEAARSAGMTATDIREWL